MPSKEINFIHELTTRKEPVWREIEKYLPHQEPAGHYEMTRDYPERQGKYFRPGLLLLATEMFGGDPAQALLTAAVMQVSEDWLLIHDDIEDHSLVRRHKPTLNELYGDELAINAGDALHIIMWKMLGDATRTLGAEIGWKVFDRMNDLLLATTEGQYLELSWIRENKIFVSEEEYLDMIRRKTANYTVIGPIQLGATIAGRTVEEIKGIAEWGVPFGYAFQIWDDYMNIHTPTGKQGKECGGDIVEGKRTLLLSHLLEHCTQNERAAVEKIYLKPQAQKTEEDKNYVIALMNTYGSTTYVKEAAQKFGAEAKVLFDKHTAHLKESDAKEIIRAGIDFVTSREH